MAKLFEKILVATDGSEKNQPAVRKGLEIARACGSAIYAVYVIDDTPFASAQAEVSTVDLYNKLKDEGERAIGQVKQIAGGMKGQMPPFDQGFATLIRDLDRTGLLNRTVVMVSSEFGRTPKVNKDAGRDHWPKVFSVVLAGGGLKRGAIYGLSNATASEPDKDPIGPEDLATTIYHLLGIVADKELMAPGNRPIEIVDGGKVLKELLA